MKLHKPIVDEIVNSLLAVFADAKYADKMIEKNLKFQKKWGSRDRRFYAESVYDCVRWWRRLWYVLGEDQELSKQSIYKLWGVWWLLQQRENELPAWNEFEQIKANGNKFREKSDLLDERHDISIAVRESVPDWLYQWGKQERGERWDKILHSLNDKAVVDLRANLLLTTPTDLQALLLKEGIETQLCQNAPEALTLVERKNVFITKAYQSGLFEVQDRSSQLVAAFLDPRPGDRVIDACAGAGGKSLHLATLMKNKGKIISLDIHQWKLDELKKRARRNRVDIIETRLIENSKIIKRLNQQADRLLLDVPCTGMGVLRRSPDTKWKLTKMEVEKLLETQSEILANYSQMLKPGGFMVYATCSIMPSENSSQVVKFINKNKNFQLLKEDQIDPDQGLGDGFYMALLQAQN